MPSDAPSGSPKVIAEDVERPRTLGVQIARRVPWLAPAVPGLMAALSGLIGWALFRHAPNVVHIVSVAVFGVVGAGRGEKARREARAWTLRAGEEYQTPTDLTREFGHAMPRNFDPRADRTEWRYPRL